MRISDWSSDVCSSDLSVQHGTTADRLLVIFGLEVEKFRTVDQTRDHLTAIERLAVVGRHHAAQFFDVMQRRTNRQQFESRLLRIPVQVLHELSRDANPFGVVLGNVSSGSTEERRSGKRGVMSVRIW